ncbi:LysR family transcriptional regulator [Alkaliphilus oremlandii]|uniref:Transcriptional regulator, LysR family n=1 Tax=Alkaliphilus oremlandii (strain OhILAs) TaxID=350688 RepID=A8MJ92_ALKOO|nr:LysR family transcriptional regulator [Alkaliphilus oremlandii]ABW19874.1 transcriptional regulator, LysR family [Alkaliphilus oremlandii OhILAs]
MDISSAKVFLAVVSTKSISRAAEMLYLSQSTISFQLKSLEAEIGVKLIERRRGHRQVEITPKGSEFISIAERFVQVWNEAHELQNKNTDNLVISSVDSLNNYAFSAFYEQLLFGENPMRLKVFTHQTPEIFEQVDNRMADVGFVLSQRKYQNVIAKSIFREKLVFAQLKDKKPDENCKFHASDLDFNMEILFDWGPEFSQWHSAWCRHDIHSILQVDTIGMLMHYLRNNYWAILPSSIVKSLQKNYPIYGFEIDEGPPDRTCYKLTHRFPKPSKVSAIESFEKQLEEYLLKNKVDFN